jgi:predicted  nucleic acid-binding Zn-ribbon protein
MKTILVISDLHCGHCVGLTPPAWQYVVDESAMPYKKKVAERRATLWGWFVDAVKQVGTIDYLLVNGDCIEGKGEHSGGTELITADRDEQADMASNAIGHIPCKKIYMTYGTPAHAGKEEDWEKKVADKVEAIKIEGEGHYDINGLQISMKHFIGNSASPVSSVTAMRAAQIKQLLWTVREQQARANLIIRSHIHRCYNVGEPALNFQGWVTPALQGLGSKYGVRQCDGLPVDFGFLVVQVENVHDWSVTPYIAPKRLEKSDVIKL